MSESTFEIRPTSHGWEIWRSGENLPSMIAQSEEQAIDLGMGLARRHAPSRLVLRGAESGEPAREWELAEEE